MDEEIEEPPSGTAAELFEIVRREAEYELSRPLLSLWWSGIVAGIALSASPIAQGLIALRLPDAGWARLLSSFGYSFGFLIVIVGRFQLFTENTVTTVLPLLRRHDLRTLGLTTRIWSVVFAANLVGAAAAAWLLVHGGLVGTPELASILRVSDHATGGLFWRNFRLGMPAGFLIAALVWLVAASKEQVWIIVGMTWLIAIGGFAHVVAGSVEVFLVAWSRGWDGVERLWTFTAASFLGNVLGGSGLFALLSYIQVRQELAPPERPPEVQSGGTLPPQGPRR